MHVIPPVPRITLSHGSVRIGVFASLQDVGRYIGVAAVRDLMHRQRDAAFVAPWYSDAVSSPPGLVVRDGDDVSVTWYEVFSACRPLERRRKSRDRLETWNGSGPVPGTGRRKNYRILRRPRTTQELRFAAGVVFEDDEPEWRARRRNVPTVYDDIILHRDHSWKHHRRTQWK